MSTDELRDEIALAVYAEQRADPNVRWLRTVDGTPNSMSYGAADAILPIIAAHVEAERFDAARAAATDAWPCDNYRSPLTCLTAPSSQAGRCDHCVGQYQAAHAGRCDANLTGAWEDECTLLYKHDGAHRRSDGSRWART